MHSKLDLTLIHPASLKPEDWLRFVEIEPFPGQWARLKLTDHDLMMLQIVICSAPKMGSVIPGTGGLRKARFSTGDSDKGKSGSFRVFYVFFQEYGIVILWAIVAKNEKSDLTKAEKNAIATVLGRYKRLLEEGRIR
jgi:hypothetical protein